MATQVSVSAVSYNLELNTDPPTNLAVATPAAFTVTLAERGLQGPAGPQGDGTVNSIAMSVPTGFAISGSPITSAGTLALAFDTGYSLPTDANQANWNTAFGWGDWADAIGTDLQSYSITLDGWSAINPADKLDSAGGTATDLTITGYKETVFALSGTTPSIDPSNGTIQAWTLTGNSTPTDSLSTGESVLLLIDDGTDFTITWTMVDVWFGGVPTLATTGYTAIELFKVGSTVYGAALPEAA